MDANGQTQGTPPTIEGHTLVVILTAIFFSAVLPFLSRPWFIGMTIGLVLLFAMALTRGDDQAVKVTLLAMLSAAWALVWPLAWPFYLLGPVLIYGAVLAITPRLRKTTTWLAWGRWDQPVIWLMGVTIVGAALCLWGWFVFFKPDVAHWRGAIPQGLGILVLILVALGFAAVNAAVEEIIFRGILQEGLETVLGATPLAVILQAIPFGMLHCLGIPNGIAGMTMAAVYGIMLGYIKRQSQGLIAPMVTHFFADIAIFGLLILFSK